MPATFYPAPEAAEMAREIIREHHEHFERHGLWASDVKKFAKTIESAQAALSFATQGED